MNVLAMDSLAGYLGRRMLSPHLLSNSLASLAEKILAISSCSQIDGVLLLGGSLARGEPCIKSMGGNEVLLSDVDLVGVIDLDSQNVDVNAAKIRIATLGFGSVSLFCVSRPDFDRLQTSIGYDFKRLGICLSGNNDWLETRCDIVIRDATDIAVFAIQEFFENNLLETTSGGPLPLESQFLFHRLAVNSVRSVCMLRGGYALHDSDEGDDELLPRLIEWRDIPNCADATTLQECVACLYRCLKKHRTAGHLKEFRNTIDGSHLSTSVYADALRQHQMVVLGLWDELFPTEEIPSPSRVRKAWDAVRDCFNLLDEHQGLWFANRAINYRRMLFQAKVSE